MEQSVTIPAGDIALEGLLSVPSVPARLGVVICHPHPLRGGDMHNNVVEGLVAAFQEMGAATLRFNFRGAGGSGGAHDDGNAEQHDVTAAVGYLLGHTPVGTLAVAGYSFGAMVGLRAGAADARVHKLVGVAPPVGTRDMSFLASVNKPKLLITGDRDRICPLADLQKLLVADPASVAIVPGADHFFGGDEATVGDLAARFLS